LLVGFVLNWMHFAAPFSRKLWRTFSWNGPIGICMTLCDAFIIEYHAQTIRVFIVWPCIILKHSVRIILKHSVSSSSLEKRETNTRVLLSWKFYIGNVVYIFVSRFSNDNEEFQWNSKKYYIDNDNLWNNSVYFYLFWFWELKSTKHGIGALNLITFSIFYLFRWT